MIWAAAQKVLLVGVMGPANEPEVSPRCFTMITGHCGSIAGSLSIASYNWNDG